MTDVFNSSWFYWSLGIALGLPVGLIVLTEWQHALARRRSFLVRPVSLLRNYLLPVGALLLLLVKATQVPTGDTSVRVVATLFAFVVLVLLLSGVNATLFQAAPEGTWRKRVPGIFVDVARFVLIAIGLALIFSYIWGANVRGLFTALGVTSIVVGLTLQNSVGQIISGLLMLFEQPFRIGDWLDTPAARGQVVEVNWRAVHIETGSGLQITPNSVLAGASFTNLSRPAGAHKLSVTTTFSLADPPDLVCATLCAVAVALPQLRGDAAPSAVPLGGKEYRASIPLKSPADDGAAKALFLRWIWYAARREGLHLDEADEEFSTPDRIEKALRSVVAPTLRLGHPELQNLVPHAKMVRYGTDEIVQDSGQVPAGMTFLISGRVRLTATAPDGSVIPLGTLDEGSFLGLTALTRQRNLSGAYALEEVTALEIDREHLAHLVSHKPLLLQDFGRIIDERRSKVRRALAAASE
ncbi:MAG: small-conductance mechanosensitive channel [Mycobacterium sp.]|jgi:small-conductance mechanosensitive channel|nr:small-conductance mechanosensitive channel [Mycobacterium sp.]